jgi:hypothetical protein
VCLPDTVCLRRDFNDDLSERRVLSLVSPTCDHCLAGLKLVLDAITGTSGVAVFVLWLNMLDGDTPQAARLAAEDFRIDGVARHYWEEEGWPVSTRLRSVLGIGPYDARQSAWDTHLLYRSGAEWDGDNLPSPTAWAYNSLDGLCVGQRLNATVVRAWLNE